MTRTALALRLRIPTVWLGLIVAILFIEAPLKFQAPGITIPLGLAIVLAGGEPGQSPWHYIYIAADLVLVGLLIGLITVVVRGFVPRQPPQLGLV